MKLSYQFFVSFLLFTFTLLIPSGSAFAGDGGGGGGDGGGDNDSRQVRDGYTSVLDSHYNEITNYRDGRTEIYDPYNDTVIELQGGGNDGRGSGPSTPYNPCAGSTYPDLTVNSIVFSDQPSAPRTGFLRNSPVLPTNLEPNVPYAPRIQITNRSCVPTDSIVVTRPTNVSSGVSGFITTTRTSEGRIINWYPYNAVPAGHAGSVASSEPTIPTIPAGASTSSVFSIEPPFSVDPGTYPVRLQIDLNDDGTVDETLYLNNVDALSAFDSTTAVFPEMTFPVGTHRLTAYVDIPGTEDPGNGCSADTGCITEVPQDNNTLSITITVTEPAVDLGSYLSTWNMPIQPAQWGSVNDISALDQSQALVLLWRVTKANAGVCTGSGVHSNGDIVTATGSSQPWNGQTRGYSSYMNNVFAGSTNGGGWYWAILHGENGPTHPQRLPAPGEYTVFTINCQSDSGGTVSDTHIITNGANVDDLLLMDPDVNTIRVSVNETIESLPFTVTNTSVSAPGSTYTIDIDGAEEGSGIINVPDTGRTSFTDTSISWTAPGTPQSLPLTVCVDHSNLVGGERCDIATIIVVDEPELSVPPTITADPTIVRQGDEFILEWDPMGNPGCELSSNAQTDSQGSPTNGSNPGSAPFTANTQSIYTISCDNGQEASVRLQVIPNIFET